MPWSAIAETSIACFCKAATSSGLSDVCVTTIPSSITSISVSISCLWTKKMSNVGLWIRSAIDPDVVGSVVGKKYKINF